MCNVIQCRVSVEQSKAEQGGSSSAGLGVDYFGCAWPVAPSLGGPSDGKIRPWSEDDVGTVHYSCSGMERGSQKAGGALGNCQDEWVGQSVGWSGEERKGWRRWINSDEGGEIATPLFRRLSKGNGVSVCLLAIT